MSNTRNKVVFNELLWLITLLIILFKSYLLLASIYALNPNTIFLHLLYSGPFPALLLISLAFVFSRHKEAIYLVILNSLLSLLFFIDIVYARAFHHLISFYMLFTTGLTTDLGHGILSLVNWSDVILFADLPLLVLIVIKKTYSTKNIGNRLGYFIIVFSISISVMCYQFITQQEGIGNIMGQPLRMSPIGFHFYDLYKFIYQKKLVLTEHEIKQIDNWLTGNQISQSDADARYFGILEDKNLIVIQVESLEGVLINSIYNNKVITPHIIQ